MQVQALVEPSEAKHKEQVIVLAAVGGAAVIISALLIMGAVKTSRS